jgi:phosphate uptake regulator
MRSTRRPLVRLYRLDSVRFGARELAKIITTSAEEVRHALHALEKSKGVVEHAVEINRLENEADRAHQEAVRRLFEDERDPLMVIKWKETLDFLEDATDRCEDVANVLEGVVEARVNLVDVPHRVGSSGSRCSTTINGFHDAEFDRDGRIDARSRRARPSSGRPSSVSSRPSRPAVASTVARDDRHPRRHLRRRVPAD